ncbi:alanine--glyoxylate aminotransferase [Pectinophora gossypiella]|uniref:alanine--glyoxylate aminotransferase n=1 Tax=Pectinophora gossypiella TaxID=13191 RepID=UPI00214F60C9|nr:alanine--glyoxylate aminotransferase [Pectinophora gossypiella]XP_049873878.1 alanine--glyoxylate aminotransferase [Pectinophora gossypiella]
MLTDKMIIPAPEIKDRKVVKPLLCGPGPCDIWPSVFEALTRPILSPMCDEMFNVMDDVRAGLQYLYQTRSKLVLAMSGSGHSGMEALITNLVGPGETLLIASRGIWDERALNIARRYGIKTVVTKVAINATFSFAQLETELQRVRPAAMFITHGDSSTGSVQRIEGLGQLCHKYGALLLVDTVVSIAASPFLMDEWEVDAVYSSTQKALSGPAGISPVAFGPRAEEKIKSRTFQPPFYLDISLLADQWNCYGNTRKYHHTLSPPLLWALRCCLKEVATETLPKSWARHAAVTGHFHKRLQEYGFQLFVPKPVDRLTTVTTVALPHGYDYLAFSKYMREHHNILIFAGLGPTVGKALRIGIMGVNSTMEVADSIADSMADTMRALTKSSL